MSCPTGHPVGQCKGLQSHKQGRKAVEQRKCQSLKGRGQMGEGAQCNSLGRCQLLVPLPPFVFSLRSPLRGYCGKCVPPGKEPVCKCFYEGLLPMCQTTLEEPSG